MNEGLALTTCTQYLRRKYYIASSASWDVAALRALADTAFATGTKEVVIIGTSSEAGGAASAQVKFDKLILLAALETLLLEVDSDNTPEPPPSGYVPDFSQRPIQT